MMVRKFFGIAMILFLACQPLTATAGELTAGDVDDNLNFDYFLEYLGQSRQADQSQVLPDITMSDRVTLTITDNEGSGFSNAFVSIRSHSTEEAIIGSHAGTDGVFRFFPTEDGAGDETLFDVVVSTPDRTTASVFFALDLDDLPGDRTVGVGLGSVQSVLPDALDIMIVMDTTGSMSDELSFLKYEFTDIMDEIADNYPNVDIRFGLVVYRDIGDKYVTKEYPFTDSLVTMQDQLREQQAGGGGDYPEAMDQALEKAVGFPWSDGNTVRLLFLVADAPPHDDRLQETMDHVMDARQKGIHIHPLAASGVADTAEYIMRTSACLTHGRYIFLTDDSGIGNPHAEPHIPGYVVTTLANTFVRVVSSELSGVRVEPSEDDIIRLVGRLENGVVPPREEPGSQDEQDESDQEEVPEDETNETSNDDGDEEEEPGTNETSDGEDEGEGTNETADDEDEVMGDGTGDGSSGDGSGGASTGDDGIRRSSPYSGSDDRAAREYSESGGTSDLYAGDSGGERAYACGPPSGGGSDDSESGLKGSSLEAPGFGLLIATTALAVGGLVRRRRKRS